MPAQLSTAEFKHKAFIVHSGHYTYENVNYTNSKGKVNITCPTHGAFTQEANSHLQGKGCSKCRTDAISAWVTKPYSTLIARADILHNSKYIYTNQPYTNQRSTITIQCPVHGEFSQVMADHLAGCGCPSCGNEARNKHFTNSPTFLYYIYFPSLNLYKIGITRNSVKERYRSENIEYIIINEELFSNGRDAYIKEQQLLKLHSINRYKGYNPFKLGGHTECFTTDVLQLHINKE